MPTMMGVYSESEAGTHGGPASLLGSYIAAGILGMFLWDFIIHLEEEYKLFLKQKISLPTIVYFWCRLSTLSNLAVAAISFAPAVDEFCFIINTTVIISLASVMISSSALLLFCVRAFYMGNTRVIAAFSLSFFLVIGISTTGTILGVVKKAALPGGTLCMGGAPPGQPDITLVQVAILIWLSNNIAVFIAIAIQLTPANPGENLYEWKKVVKVRHVLRGDHLPELSRVLWWDCQKYILAFTFTSLVVITVFSINHFPDIYGFVAIGPHVAIQNCMISYLIRNVRASSLNSSRNMDLSFLTNSDSMRNPG